MRSRTVTRREALVGLAALAGAPAAFGQATAPPGSARYLVELIAFRQPGALPKAMPAAPPALAAALPGRVTALAESDLQLVSVATALTRRGYALLAHTAWAAIVPANGRTTAQLEELLPPNTAVSGAVALQRSQYLFLGVEVDYQAEDGLTFGLREKRRIKFGERHYFDHPAFGVIAQVTQSRGEPAAD
jgi:hypothetical protein